MSLDGIVVRSLAHQLELCIGGRINKIHQPSPHDIVLQIRAQSANYRLLLSANPTYPRLHLTEETFQNPTEPPMFCMLMRKHCEGAIIERIEQVGLERIMHIDVRHRDELGDLTVRRIVIELMGRHSNIILVDPATNQILDGIHHVTPAISSYRIVMPGSSYTAPPEQNKTNPLLLTKAEFIHQMSVDADAEILRDRRLVQQFSGMSPLIAKEIVYRAALQASDHELERLWDGFHSVMEPVRSNGYTPNIIDSEQDGKAYFSVVELTHLTGRARVFSTISECLESFYSGKAERDTVKQRTSDLNRFLQNEIAKNQKKLEKLEDALREGQDADKFRIIGELLIASLHLVNRGDRQVEVLNYYDEDQRMLTIALDPQLTPAENAQRYFKKYSKLKNSLGVVGEQVKSAHEEIAYLGTILAQLETASLRDIEEIREELMEQGYLRDRQKKTIKKKKPDRPSLTCYTSSEGIAIYVGKNNLQNEYLTNRLAQAGDTWLHTKDIPGSHVVIRSGQYGEATLHEAAQLAAYFSQARASSQVPVDYTLIRHVRKPNGAKPGFVIYEQQKTLYVTPEEDRILAMPMAVKS
jgi:predicted ribosome quality control (RQC) complex YloA/Tae2 family protein